MAIQWFFSRDDETFGPFTAAELKAEAASARLRPQDLVWQEGMEKSVRASKVKHLFDAPAVPSPVAPAPPPPAESAPAPDPGEEEEEPAAEHEEAPTPLPEEPVPPAAEPPPKPAAKKYRVLSVKGGMLLSQDGERFRYRKVCPKCGHKDASVTSAPIQPGTVRAHFFCPKCRRSQPVEIHSAY